MVLSERQLRFIVRQELLTYLNQQERIDENIIDALKDLGRHALLGLTLGVGAAGAGVANMPDVNPKQEISNVVEETKEIEENFVFEKSGDGYAIKFKDPKTGIVNQDNVLKVSSKVAEQAKGLGKIRDYKSRQTYINQNAELKDFIYKDTETFINGDKNLKEFQQQQNISVAFIGIAALLIVFSTFSAVAANPYVGSTSRIPPRRRY
jgi:hypothetical protein